MDEANPELPGLSRERSDQIKAALMAEIEADRQAAAAAKLAVWHYRDRSVKDENVSLCGAPWRDPVGVVQPCDDCVKERLRRRREANPSRRPVL